MPLCRLLVRDDAAAERCNVSFFNRLRTFCQLFIAAVSWRRRRCLAGIRYYKCVQSGGLRVFHLYRLLAPQHCYTCFLPRSSFSIVITVTFFGSVEWWYGMDSE